MDFSTPFKVLTDISQVIPWIIGLLLIYNILTID